MRRRFYGSPPINFNPLHPAPALPKPHYPSKSTTTLASLVKGRWLDGKAQALTLLHLLAIRPPFLYCKLFCRQDGGIVTPPYPRPAPKIAPHSMSERKCGGVVESCLLCWFRIVRNLGQALSRILAFAVVWVAASLQRLCATAIVHPCTSCLLCWFRIVPRQPFGLPHRVATKCG